MTEPTLPTSVIDAVRGLLQPAVAPGGTLDCLVAVNVCDGALLEFDARDHAGAVRATVLVSAGLTPAGDVGEVRWGRVEPAVPVSFDVAAATDESGGRAPDGARVFEMFRAALGEGPRAAAHCFTFDGVFSHASFRPGGPRVLARGREAIEAALEDRRPGPPTAEVSALGQVGRWVLIDGWGTGPQGRRPFVSTFTMDDAGQLVRYSSVGTTLLTGNS